MHLITILFQRALFERTSKPIHNNIRLNADWGNLLNDQRNYSQSFSFMLFTKKVLDALLAIDNNKSTGGNHLDPGLLKCAAPIIVGSITKNVLHYQEIYSSIPKVWKSALVLPLHSGGDSSDLNNYLPFSRFPCLAKTLESLANVQLCWGLGLGITLLKQPHSAMQSGFRAGHGCTIS
jgi:hypothetical protein